MNTNDIQKLKLWAAYTPPLTQSFSFENELSSYHLLRLDLIQSWASGNKYYKLKYVIHDALTQGYTSIISKGGMFSNHLEALSKACVAFDLHLIAMIRSYGADEMNPSIQKLRATGHEIVYMNPSAYNTFDANEANKLFPGALFIPEGGMSNSGIKGASEIALHCISQEPTHIVIAGGTMTTVCGLMAALPSWMKIIIVPAWKGCSEAYIHDMLSMHEITPECTWEIWSDFHFGGFGKYDHRLIEFMTSFSKRNEIPLDPVYTGKLLFAIHQKSKENYFGSLDRVLAIHTGGLQGLDGYRYRFPDDWGAYLKS